LGFKTITKKVVLVRSTKTTLAYSTAEVLKEVIISGQNSSSIRSRDEPHKLSISSIKKKMPVVLGK
jgi:hypothetical protein